MKGAGGWLGFTDKYWASADHAGPDRTDRRALLRERGRWRGEDYQTDFVAAAVDVAPGASASQPRASSPARKEVSTIDGYVRDSSASRSSI